MYIAKHFTLDGQQLFDHGHALGQNSFFDQLYRSRLKLDPNELTALNNLAWRQATRPKAAFGDSDSAVRLATEAFQLTVVSATKKRTAPRSPTRHKMLESTGRSAAAVRSDRDRFALGHHDSARLAGTGPLLVTSP